MSFWRTYQLEILVLVAGLLVGFGIEARRPDTCPSPVVSPVPSPWPSYDPNTRQVLLADAAEGNDEEEGDEGEEDDEGDEEEPSTFGEEIYA